MSENSDGPHELRLVVLAAGMRGRRQPVEVGAAAGTLSAASFKVAAGRSRSPRQTGGWLPQVVIVTFADGDKRVLNPSDWCLPAPFLFGLTPSRQATLPTHRRESDDSADGYCPGIQMSRPRVTPAAHKEAPPRGRSPGRPARSWDRQRITRLWALLITSSGALNTCTLSGTPTIHTSACFVLWDRHRAGPSV